MRVSPTQLRFIAIRGGRGRRSAFTLLELVVSLLMVAVLVIPLYSSMRTAFKAQQSAEAIVEPARTVELAMDLIRSDIQSVVLPNPNAANLAHALAGPFYGNPGNDDRGHQADDLIFYTTADGPKSVDVSQPDPLLVRQQSTPVPDIRQVELTVVADGTDHVLLRRVTSNLLSEATIAVNPDDEVLLRGVSSFSVQYFNGTSWFPNWDSEDDNAIPLAVEITLEIERPGGTVLNGQGLPVMRFVRVFQIPCSSGNPDTSQATTGG